jgi:hypothetical protein
MRHRYSRLSCGVGDTQLGDQGPRHGAGRLGTGHTTALKTFLKTEIEKWARIIKQAAVSPGARGRRPS